MNKTLRSVLAVLAGLVAVVILSEGTDTVLRAAGWFPARANVAAMTTAMFAAATIFRTLAGLVGGYVAAALAPNRALGHAIALGGIGLAANIMGVVFNATSIHGPVWYPIALAITAFPSTWLGGRLRAGSPREANA